MNAPQGLITFSNLPDFVSASMTLTQGVGPSVCIVETPPLDRNPYNTLLNRIGDLTWSYRNQTFTFRSCIVDKIEPVGDSSGLVSWRIAILDRRWIWRQTGAISGNYNDDKEDVNRAISGLGAQKPNTKTLRQLIDLCLTALGEPNARVEITNGTELYPETKWDYEQPVDALADLCDRSNNVVTLGLDDVVRITTKGIGNLLPRGDFIDEQQTVDPPESPQAIVVVSSPVKYQLDFRLEAVGKEVDGTVKPIHELSYAPKIAGVADWSECDPYFMTKVESKYREIAQESVWRWYRIIPAKNNGPSTVASVLPELREIKEVTPLLSEQVEEYRDSDNKLVPRPPWVYGKFSPLEDRLASKDDAKAKISNQPDGLYTGSFSVDTDKGIVQFQSPVITYKNTKNGGNGPPVPGLFIYEAEIYLRIAVNYNPQGFEGVRRKEYFENETPGSRRIKINRSWTRFVLDEAVEPVTYYDYEANKKVDTTEEEKPKARKTWKTVVAEYTTPDLAETVSYAGLEKIQCDGAITQVTWQIAKNGQVTTRASRNREESFVAPDYAERRVQQRLVKMIRRTI